MLYQVYRLNFENDHCLEKKWKNILLASKIFKNHVKFYYLLLARSAILSDYSKEIEVFGTENQSNNSSCSFGFFLNQFLGFR